MEIGGCISMCTFKALCFAGTEIQSVSPTSKISFQQRSLHETTSLFLLFPRGVLILEGADGNGLAKESPVPLMVVPPLTCLNAVAESFGRRTDNSAGCLGMRGDKGSSLCDPP